MSEISSFQFIHVYVVISLQELLYINQNINIK